MRTLNQRILEAFNSQFGDAEVMAFAPGRINIIGEHTDYNDGFVFPAAIDKGIIAVAQKSNESYSKVLALDVEDSIELRLDQLNAIPNGGWKNYVIGVIAEIKKIRQDLPNFNLVFGGNIPIGGGVSSSAALENSIGFALNELFDLGLSKMDLIKISQRADHNYVGVKSGIMDHFASMFGEKETALLLDCRSLEAQPYPIQLGNYQFLLINSNVSHSLAASAYNDRRAACERVAATLERDSLRNVSFEDLETIKDQLSKEDYTKASFVLSENERTLLAGEAMQNQDLVTLGELLYLSHEGLRHHYQVSCDELDFLVDSTKSAGTILGARMMGGGFGGCTINLIKKDSIAAFKSEISTTYKKQFNNSCTFYDVNISRGTHLIAI